MCKIIQDFRKLTAIDLVAAIGTFGRTWAHQMARNTGHIVALKLVIAARFILAIQSTLIVTIGTIRTTIAKPLSIDARNFVTTQIVSWWTNRHGNVLGICTILFLFRRKMNNINIHFVHTVQTKKSSYEFIRSVRAIGVIVAPPLLSNARPIATLEIIFFTFLLWTI